MVKILAFAGSARKESYNKKLAAVAASAAEKAGASVTLIDMADFDIPLFNEDLEAEQGMPADAKRFKNLLVEHDGFLIASPEYNSSYSALLKNAIDWATRAEEGEPMLVAFSGKVAGLLAASPGALGGLRGLVNLRMLLGNIGVHVIPKQLAMSKAHEQFADDGSMVNEKQAKNVAGLAETLVSVTEKLS